MHTVRIRSREETDMGDRNFNRPAGARNVMGRPGASAEHPTAIGGLRHHNLARGSFPTDQAPRPTLSCKGRMRVALFFASAVIGVPNLTPAQSQATSGPTLVSVGTPTRIQETDSLLISQPSGIATGARGAVFIGDISGGRVLQIGRTGALERILGKKGRGPGELVWPGALAVSGDTLLAVYDVGARQVTFFSLRTGSFIKSVAIASARPALAFRGSELLVTTFDLKLNATVVPVTVNGGVGAPEGALPPIVSRLPMLAGGFYNAAVVADGSDVLTSFEVSSAVIRTRQGARTGTMTELPAVRRRGVNEVLYDEMVRDPTAARRIAFAHSVPMAAQMIGTNMLALATVDPTQVGRGFTGVYFVTLVDFAKKAVCPDLAVPVAVDPMPYATFRGDTLVVLVQPDGKSDAAASYIHRFWIDAARCTWRPLPSPKRIGG